MGDSPILSKTKVGLTVIPEALQASWVSGLTIGHKFKGILAHIYKIKAKKKEQEKRRISAARTTTIKTRSSQEFSPQE